MQAQTTGRHFGTFHKLAAGLLIVAALVAGIVGLATIGNLEIAGSRSQSEIVAPAMYPAVGPMHGEGLPRSALPVTSNLVEEVPGRDRQFVFPQGEGYTKNLGQRVPNQQASPLGEGLPKGSGR